MLSSKRESVDEAVRTMGDSAQLELGEHMAVLAVLPNATPNMIFIRHWLQLLAASVLWSSAVVCLGSAFRDLLGIASALVLSSEVQDTVGVNLESHLSGVHRGVLRQLLLVLPL